jgi:hypothetical protein
MIREVLGFKKVLMLLVDMESCFKEMLKHPELFRRLL